jgi:hypothetical protein
MPENAVERRRWRRSVVPVGQHEELEVGLSLTVRILDLSLAGALLQSPVELFVGQRAMLRTVLSGQSFEAEAEVRHVHLQSGAHGSPAVRMGVVFVGLDRRNSTLIHGFLPA